MIIDELIERASAVGGPVPDIEAVEYDEHEDDVVVLVYFENGFNFGNPIIGSIPAAELVDRDMFEFALHLRFGCRKALRATA